MYSQAGEDQSEPLNASATVSRQGESFRAMPSIGPCYPPGMFLSPESLRPSYAAFLDARPGDDGGPARRILLTGHSHQAWPDVAEAGLRRAFAHAAMHVDDKWARAEAQAQVLRRSVAGELGGRPEDIALAPNSHELATRFLSSLDWRRRLKVVTTNGEFHSVARQLARLEEEGVQVVRVPVQPLGTLAERMRDAIDDTTAAVIASTVLFETSSVVPNLEVILDRAERHGAEVLFDAYHQFRVVPPGFLRDVVDRAFVSGGGYKYAQWGEGCCFLRVPPSCERRPVFTGWFASFDTLEDEQEGVSYGPRQADRFAGSTYDPASHYRAASVVDFFHAKGMDVEALRELSLHQTGRLLSGLEQLPGYDTTFQVVTPHEAAHRGGFVAVRIVESAAPEIVHALRRQGVYVDSRGDVVRFGPAPYLLDSELDAGVAAFGDVLRQLQA